MYYKKNNNDKTVTRWGDFTVDVDSPIYADVKVHDWDDNCTYDIRIRLDDFVVVTVYGVRRYEGSNGDFLSEAARKSKDGRYYKYYYLCDDVKNRVIEHINK